MGMTIDDCIKMLIAKEKCMERETGGTDTDCNFHNCDDCSLCYEQGTMREQKMALLFAVDAMRKYQLMQADYENRLKADMVIMLEEIQSKIVEESWTRECLDGLYQTIVDIESVNEVFQQKINALKAESEDV